MDLWRMSGGYNLPSRKRGMEATMDKKKILDALNLDLEHEMAAIVRYLHHSFIVTGPTRGPLVDMFRRQAQDSMQHAIKLGEKEYAHWA